MKALINFIKYNNGFPILLVVLFLGAGVAFAANKVTKQDALFSSATAVPQVALVKIDTAKLLAINLNTYDAKLKITAVTENSENYFVEYAYQTLAIVDTVWKTVPKTGTLTVAKKMLGARDLGLYVAEQLGQVVDQKIAYLKEVQSAEKAKTSGAKQTSGGEYASLAGSQLDAKDKTFGGYKPVVTTKDTTGTKNTKTSDKQASSADIITVQTDTQIAQSILSKKEIQDMIVTAVAQFLAVDISMPEVVAPMNVPSSTIPDAAVVPENTVLESAPVVGAAPTP